MSPIIVAILGLIAVVLAATLPVWLLNRSQAKARKEDRAEREEAARVQKQQTDDAAKQATDAAAALKVASKIVADALEVSDKQKGKAEEEVARLAAATAASASVGARGMLVTLVYPNGERQDVRLTDAPRQGDHIRLDNGADAASWVVVLVLWAEAKEGHDPAVVAVVRRHQGSSDSTPVPPGGALEATKEPHSTHAH